MNNKIKIITFTLLTSLLALSGCDNAPEEWKPGENAIEGAVQPTNTNPTGELTNLNKMRISQNKFGLPSIGNPNILVVPVTFKNDVVVEKETGLDLTFSEEDIAGLNRMFFGDDDPNLRPSVKSYYKTSSYGKLNIDGVITPKVTYKDDFISTIQNITYGTKTVEGVYEDMLNQIYNYLFVETQTYNLDHFDSNKDGKIDSVHIVFNYPYNLGFEGDANMTNALSTFLTCLDVKFSNQLDENTLFNSATFNSYEWYSNTDYGLYSSMPISLIGNAIGLDNYADLVGKGDEDGTRRSPMGNMDMMDLYIGDHSAFSKYQLGWIEPTVINKNDIPENDELAVNISKLEKEGDALVLAIGDDHDPFSEYLILEYYSPTGLNKYDFFLFSKPGIKVTHVDARLIRGYGDVYMPYDGEFDFDAEITLSNNEKVKYVYDYRHTNNYYNNYLDYGITSNNPLCMILSKDGMNRHATEFVMLSDSALFYAGDTFGSDDQIEGFYKNFAFYDGDLLGIEFEVTSLADDATITLRRAD